MRDANGHIECSASPMIVSSLSAAVTPVIAVVPPTGPPGRTTFTLTYQNLAEPAIDATRFAELQGYINTIYGSFAGTLGNSRDLSDPANAINVNVNVNLASISQAFLITVLFGGPPVIGDPAWYQDTCWRIRITKYYSPGVPVLEVPLAGFVDPNVWPSNNLPTNQPLAFLYDTTTGEVRFSNVTSAPGILTPPAWLILNPTIENTQFYWNYILPSGSTIVPNTIPPLEFVIDSVPTGFTSPAVASPSLSPFYASLFTITIGIASPNTIGLSILAQAGPISFSYIPNAQNQTTLWDPTGQPLPTPRTPFRFLTGATSPLVTTSQWRFLRVLPDWLTPAAASLRSMYDADIPLHIADIEVQINTDSNRLQTGFYDFSDSYLVSNQALYCFKGLLVHELIHGLGFINAYGFNAGGGETAVTFYNHYSFRDFEFPLTPAEFQTQQRSLSNINWITNGAGLEVPIEPTSQSHLYLTSFSQNGIMEPILYPGNLIPIGTAPFGGPSTNDLDVLLCCSILSSADSICVKEDTLVLTLEGQKRITEITQGDLVQNERSEWIPVQCCVEISSHSDFVVIPKGVLGQSSVSNDAVPSQDLYIRSGHPILINGYEVDCAQLVGTTRFGCDPVRQNLPGKGRVRVYTLVTEERYFVNMQGVLVGTWGRAAWENYRLNENSHFNALCH